MVLTAVLLVAAGYQVFALIACLHRLRFRERPRPEFKHPPVSILKPIRGADPGFYEAIRSHVEAEYAGDVEILFGVRTLADSAVPAIRRLIAEFPHKAIRLIEVHTSAPNQKVGSLIDLAREARHGVLLVNDSDIVVPRDYLTKVIAPLEDPKVGLVTCLYRARGASFAGWFEALGVDTDFAPSTLVAPFVGIDEFALGSTLAFRRADLERIGGFEPIGDYIADDYQLGHRIHGLGLKCYLAEPVVETTLGAHTFLDAWRHQVRWTRTIRACRGDGYIGLPVTFATFWALIGLLAGQWELAVLAFTARMAVAIVSSVLVLQARDGLAMLLLTPLRDLWAVAVWMAGFLGRRVYWRDFSMTLDHQGRIVSVSHHGG